jgi:hypothetical protein
MRCIVTNDPVEDSEYQTWNLPCIPRWLIVLMYLGMFFLLTAPQIRVRCRVRAGLSKKVRRRRMWRKLAGILLIVLPGFVIAWGLVARSELIAQLGLLGVLASYFGLTAYVLRWSPLRARFYQDGVFWITGCSPAFLASLAASLAEQQSFIIELDESAIIE